MEADKLAPTSIPSQIADDDQLSENSPLLPASSSSSPSSEVKKASMRNVTVEPVVLLIAIAFSIYMTVQPQYIKERLADARNFSLSLDEDSENSGCSSENTSDPDYIIEQEIQADVSFWQMILSICSFFPSLFTAPIIGAWSDQAGRKLALGLPVIGYLIVGITFLLVYYFVLPLWIIAIGYSLQSITGGYALMLAGCYAYIADVTTKEKRMIRIAVVHAIFYLGLGGSQIVVGFLVAVAGFGPSFWIAVVCYIGSLIYLKVPSVLIETIQTTTSQDKVLDKSKLESVYQLFHTNADSRRLKLILLLFIAFLTETFVQGSLSLLIIYGLGPPFCWSSVLVGLYSATSLLLSGAAMIGGTRGLAMCLADDWILQVGMIFGVVNSLLNAFATSTLGLFLVLVLTLLQSVQQPMFHLMFSKLVTADEQGVMFACESSVLNLASFCSPLILNSIYTATVETQPNSVFLMMSVFRTLVVVVLGFFQVVIRYTRNPSTAAPIEIPTDKVKEESKMFE